MLMLSGKVLLLKSAALSERRRTEAVGQVRMLIFAIILLTAIAIIFSNIVILQRLMPRLPGEAQRTEIFGASVNG